MNFRLALCVLSGAVLMAAAPMPMAQPGPGPMKGGPFPGGRPEFGFRGPVAGAPYSALRTITHVQTLAGGNTISHTTTDTEARDSDGRTYRQETIDRNGKSFTATQVFDPVSHVMISWNSDSQKANLVHLPDKESFKGLRDGDGSAPPRPERPEGFRRDGVKPTVEQLGPKSFGSVNADGTRTTFVIPAGKEGNSEPITITHESWFALVLKMDVLRIDTDPRNGTTTTSLSNIDQNAPQESLFQVPQGYTVEERSRGKFPRP